MLTTDGGSGSSGGGAALLAGMDVWSASRLSATQYERARLLSIKLFKKTRVLIAASGTMRADNDAAAAVSSTTPERLEETLKTIRVSDRPWSRRLMTLQAVDRVSPDDLDGLVKMMQAADFEHWPAPGIFPGEEGGLRFEWHEGRQHTTFEVGDSGNLYVYFFDFARGAEIDVEPQTIGDAVTFLREHLV